MIIPVILSGGSGTRLWPLSRRLHPKQFLNLVNEKTLFQETIIRLPKETTDPLIICNEAHRFIVAEQLRQIKSKNKGIILEPIGKNTAPAIAIAAMNLLNEENDPTLLVLSADHLIEDDEQFDESIKIAKKISDKGKMVALGVRPHKPEIGYGYIKVDKSQENKYYNIISFKEKPNLTVAKKYLESRNYYWNSGIFVFKASTYLKELEKYEPEIFSICKRSLIKSTKDLDFIHIDNKTFYDCPDKSIDYAVMEKTKEGVVVPFLGKWSDIGSWESLWDSKSKDNNNNVIEGDVELSKVKNSFVHSSSRLVVVNDLSDLIIIDTKDALLVSSKYNSQDIKKIVNKLKKSSRSESDNHQKIYRSWGNFDLVDYSEDSQIKHILVYPGGTLPLLEHKKIVKHWVIVKGVALITCGDKVFQLKQNESTLIPNGVAHKLINLEKESLRIIEIQTGKYLGNDDIKRLEDK